MEHPTTGRRRQRSGAVSVAELVERSQPVEAPKVVTPTSRPRSTSAEAPTRHAAPAATIIPAADAPPMPSETPERGSGTLAKVCRTAGLALGVLAVAAGVTTAWAINQSEPQHQATPQPRYEITGADALHPDALAEHLDERRPADRQQTKAAPRPPASDGQADPDNRPTKRTESTRGTADGPAAPTRPTATETVPEDRSTEALVRRFYRLLGSDPGQAAGLLDPALLGTDRASFVQAWREMRNLRVEDLVEQADGTVTAVVRMLEPDGSWLRVRQQFNSTGADLPLIGNVRLLSAQRG